MHVSLVVTRAVLNSSHDVTRLVARSDTLRDCLATVHLHENLNPLPLFLVDSFLPDFLFTVTHSA